jgi:hypothetical protein
MATATQDKPTTNKAEQRKAARKELDKLALKVITDHGAIGTLNSRALDHAREAGEHLKAAKALCKQVRLPDKTRLKWATWVQDDLDMTRQTANTYVRIFDMWDKVKDLQGDQRSIRGAVALIRELDSKDKTRTKAKPKPIELKSAALKTAVSKYVKTTDTADMTALVNAVLKLAGYKATVAIKD